MAFTVLTFEQIRDVYLQAVRNNGKPDAPIGPDSDNYVRACALAAVVEGIYAHQAWVFRQAFPDLADVDVMERMANQKGLTRKPAAAAAGTVRFTGTVGTPIAINTQVFTSQGTRYQTLAGAVVDVTGYIDVACAALVAGAAGNLSNSTPVTVDSPPAGVLAAASALTMTSGADTESNSALLGRLLLRLANPPQGGALADYQQWGLAVPGVVRALVFPLRRGRGTVDVVPMPATGLPSGPLVTAVQTYIDSLRPVGLGATGFQALAPTAVPVAITMTLTYVASASPAVVQAAVSAAIDSLFGTLAPGATLILNQLVTSIMSVAGVKDVAVSAPAGNTASTVDASNMQLLTKGVVTFL